MTDVGQGWLMTTLAPSPLMVALMLTAESLPFFLLGLPAGALADVADRRRLLLVTQGAMALVAATLAAATFAGVMTPWLLLWLAFAMGTATALNDPAWHATAPDLLPSEDLAAGVTLNGVGLNVARTVGPALGGGLVAAAGPGTVFVLDAVSFLGVVGVLFAWRRERVEAVLPAERMVGAVRAGLRFARHSAPLRRVLLRVFSFMACGVAVMALMPVLARATGRGATALGLLLGSFGGGAVMGAMALPRLRARLSTDALITLGSLAFGGVALATGVLRALPALCPVLAAGGVAWIAVLSSLNVAAQRASPPWVRGRALAVYLIVLQAGIAGGSALWGFVATRYGLAAAYGSAAAGLVLGGISLARMRLAPGEGLDFRPSHHWADPEVEGTVRLEDGPVLVQVEYTVEAARAAEFEAMMRVIGRSRRRDGAVQWWLFRDTGDPACFLETWIVETWAEHLRQHERVSVADQQVEERARALLTKPFRVRHFVAAGPATTGDRREPWTPVGPGH